VMCVWDVCVMCDVCVLCVCIGIHGVEGTAAVRASDYAISQVCMCVCDVCVCLCVMYVRCMMCDVYV